jgi:hypothetical protein
MVVLGVLGAGIGVVSAATINGRIIKIGGKTVTIAVGKKGQKTERTLELAAKVKVAHAAKKGTGKLFTEGLNAAALQNLGKKGRHARLITNSNNKVTEIVILEHAKKKKNQRSPNK